MKSEKVEVRVKDEAARESTFQEREAYWQRWIDDQLTAWVEGGGTDDLETGDLLPEALAQHHDALDQEMAQLDAKLRAENGVLRRQLVEREIAHTTERRQRIEQASAMRRRIGVLEAQLAHEKQEREALANALAMMQREIAKDRALHRMRDGRRLLPHAQRADLERARRKTDRAIEDRMLEGGFDA